MKALLSLFSFFGKYASYTLPIGVFIGIAVPQLAAYLKPFLLPVLLIPLTLSLVRIQVDELIASFKNWRLVLLLAVWVLVLCPLIVWFALSFFDLPNAINMAAIIAAAAPPVTACAAIAIFLRINAAIAVVITVVTMLLVPLTLPLILKYLVQLDVRVELWQLSLRLSAFILSAFILAFILKRVLGSARINRSKATLDGISVILVATFTIGVMNGVTELFFQKPHFVLLTLLISSVIVFFLYCLSTLVFWRLGASKAMAVGLCCGNFNLGLMYLVLVHEAPLDLLIFFGIGQIPMYILPTLLSPLVNRLNVLQEKTS